MTDMISMLDCRYKLGATRLAAAAMCNAFTEKEDSWFKDVESDHPFSLRWCCLAISLGIGETLDPDYVASRYFELGEDVVRVKRFDTPGATGMKMHNIEDAQNAQKVWNDRRKRK